MTNEPKFGGARFFAGFLFFLAILLAVASPMWLVFGFLDQTLRESSPNPTDTDWSVWLGLVASSAWYSILCFGASSLIGVILQIEINTRSKPATNQTANFQRMAPQAQRNRTF